MEKQSSISSSKYIGSTLDNVILNSNINLIKMKEVLDTLDKAANAIIIPVLKIKKKISRKFDFFAKEYTENKDKVESSNEEIISHLEEYKFDSKNINDINSKYGNSQDTIISLYENITKNRDIFTNLINSQEYNKLIKGFDEIIPDKEMFAEEEKEKEKENEKEKEKKNEKEKDKEKTENEKTSKESNKVKKPKRPTQKKNSKKSMKKLGSSKTKDKKKIQQQPRKKKKERDLLETLQKEFPSNQYVQKISKTFLSRRLGKKVIYRHYFIYKGDGTIEENRIRSSGESTVYKYCKTIFNFYNDNITNTEKIDEMMGKELKQQFAKLDYDNKEYIIGGKIGCSLDELINRVFKQDLLKELMVVKATLEFYEFYEELVSEFDEKDKNVRIIFCDEKILKHLRDDWKNLEMVRKYVEQKKAERSMKNNTTNNNNNN